MSVFSGYHTILSEQVKQSLADAMSNNDLATIKRVIRNHIDSCMIVDRFPILRLLERLKEEDSFKGVVDRFEKSVNRLETRILQQPRVSYPPLPVSERKADIIEAIQTHQVVVIAGETGSGKTTQLPKMCMEAGRGVAGLIAHTQPRRLAARSVASRIADELQSPLGEAVGFKIRFTDQVSEQSVVKLMTDGILLAEMQQDRFLNAYDTIIIDEAHERSLNIDFLLGYLKQLLPKRPDLKIIITSATIDPERFSNHFNNAPIIEVSGRTYPVEIRYRDGLDDQNDLEQIDKIIAAVDELMTEPLGDILVFLSGERDIRDTQQALQRQQYRHTEIIPLFARLSASEQNKIFQSHSGRRIILSTNVAETSLTVPGIKYVVDTGLARISRYSPGSKVQRLPIEAISQASANQRAGRCGRISEGICIRLYSEEDFNGRPEYTDPEILRTNLASVILQMMSLGLGNIQAFPFVQPPDSRSINDGYRLLEELEAIKSQNGRQILTEIGRRLARLPLDPRYARMVIAAKEHDCVNEVMIIAAGLSIQDPRERPQDKKQQADEKHKEFADKESDFIALFNLWKGFLTQQKALTNNQLRKWCKTHFIHYLRMREWQDIVSQIKKSLSELSLSFNPAPASQDAIHKAILTGLLSHVGMKEKDNDFLGARNTKFWLFPGSFLAKTPPKWIVSAELVETARLFGRFNAKIDPQWIEPLATHLSKSSFSEPHWSKKRGAVMAYEKVTLLGIPIVTKRLTNYANHDPAACREIFIREALVNQEHNMKIDVLTKNALLIEQGELLEHKTRRRDWLVDEDTLFEFYDTRIPEHVLSESSFKKWWQKAKDKDQLIFNEQTILQKQPTKHIENQYPEHWYQDSLTLSLVYHFEPSAQNDGVTCKIPLPIINQIQNVGFDWLVPGLLEEKITALIRGLPKKLRKNFVRAPQFAQAVMSDIESKDKKGKPTLLLDALSNKLFRMTGIKIEKDEWDEKALAAHLRMHFEVVDNKGQSLDCDDDLLTLQQKMQGQIKATINQSVSPELERKGLKTWDFDAIPKVYTKRHSGFEMQAYPALISRKGQGSVDIELLSSEAQAIQQHRLGVAALLTLSMPSPLNYLQEKLPNKAKLGLYFNPFGQIKPLIDDCIKAGVLHLLDTFCADGNEIRDQQVFTGCHDYVRANINDQVLSIAKQVEKGLTIAHGIQKQLKGKVPLQLINAMGQIKEHLNTLVYPGFVSDFGAPKLDDWIRYLMASEKRIEKVIVDPQRDKLHQLSIDKVTNAQTVLIKQYSNQPIPNEVNHVRWMIEEYRVSLFAQQLGTSYPISEKRILNYINDIG